MDQLTKAEAELLRQKCRTDLYYLAKTVLKKGLYEKTHKPITNFFVQKAPFALAAGYTIDDLHHVLGTQDNAKERLLLYPRSSYKSTLNVIDAVQWIICFPDVRILVLTGEFKLAKAFVREIKSYFTIPKDGNPTDFQQLFPEFCITSGDQDDDTLFWCPARVIEQKEPTVWANSITANLSGWHCDVLKCDDAVTDENSRTEDARDTLLLKFDTVLELLDPWGYLDMIGTRYAPFDLYGSVIKRSNEQENPLKYLCAASMTRKPGFETVPLLELTEDQVDLLFPEKLSFKVLRKKLLKNETVFRCQQLNEPVAVMQITFDSDALRAHLIQWSAVPQEGFVVVAWDWATSGSSTGDFSCGVAARVIGGKLFLLEILCGRFKPSELAFQIVAFSKKWNPRTTIIEKSAGAELLELEVKRNMARYSILLNLVWQQPSTKKDAKANRIKGLETLLNSERLWFVSGPWIDQTFEQFHRYTGETKNRGRHEDIPDAVSYLQLFLPKAVVTEEDKVAQEEIRRKQIEKDYIAAMFGYTPPEAEQVITAAPSDNSLNKIFGGNGMHI